MNQTTPTTEQLKADAIRKEWLKHVSEPEFNRMEKFIAPNGVYDDPFNQANITTVFALNLDIEKRHVDNGTYGRTVYRPKPLSNIENNNGWIVLSDETFPNESGFYDLQDFRKGDYVRPNFTYISKGATKIGWFLENYSHYKPLEKTKPIF